VSCVTEPYHHCSKHLHLLLSTERCASQDGVNVHYQKHASTPTGTCAVLVHGGERSLIANLAAANTFTADHLESAKSTDIISATRIFYVTGFFLTVSVEAILKLARHSVENNKTFVFNLSAPFLIQFFADQMAAVMPYADFVFGNEVEAATYGAAKGYGTDLNEIALKLAAEPKASGTRPRVVVFPSMLFPASCWWTPMVPAMRSWVASCLSWPWARACLSVCAAATTLPALLSSILDALSPRSVASFK
jgi:sugar/nucleoside kinase (ribokinase family)